MCIQLLTQRTIHIVSLYVYTFIDTVYNTHCVSMCIQLLTQCTIHIVSPYVYTLCLPMCIHCVSLCVYIVSLYVYTIIDTAYNTHCVSLCVYIVSLYVYTIIDTVYNTHCVSLCVYNTQRTIHIVSISVCIILLYGESCVSLYDPVKFHNFFQPHYPPKS